MSDINLEKYRAIVFDLDSTLTDTHRYPIRASEWLLSKIQSSSVDILQAYVTELVKHYRSEIKAIVNGRPYKTPFQVVHDAISTTLAALEIPATSAIIIEATQVFKDLHLELSEIAPGVSELLSFIQRRSLAMGVITNSFEGHAKVILERIGISKYFAAVVDGGVSQAYKPMPQPFEHAMATLRATSKNTLYIGDEFVADIIGSKSLGLDCIWLNNRNLPLEDYLSKHGSQYAPDLVIESISELLQHIS
ncbi:MAG: HAD family hydrolase [Promethearchaeota archaeon]